MRLQLGDISCCFQGAHQTKSTAVPQEREGVPFEQIYAPFVQQLSSSSRELPNRKLLVQETWGGAQGFAFLIGSQVLPLLHVQGLPFETHWICHMS